MKHEAEENYLKVIYKIWERNSRPVATTAIAEKMGNNAASVTDMLKRLAEKQLIHYERYKGVTLTDEGRFRAVKIIRKHRLWEVFLVKNLGFGWEEVDEIAEQLEHILSDDLLDRLDQFLGFPRFDPHGDPIPDKEGVFEKNNWVPLSKANPGMLYKVVNVTENSASFLKFIDKLDISLNDQLLVMEMMEYDGSVLVNMKKTEKLISKHVAENILLAVIDR